MTDIVFEQTLGGNFFSFKDEKGNDNWFDYRPKVDGLWKDIKLSDFDVQLLIHPVLNKESNTFALEAKVNDVDETIGYLFPVAALDSDPLFAQKAFALPPSLRYTVPVKYERGSGTLYAPKREKGVFLYADHGRPDALYGL